MLTSLPSTAYCRISRHLGYYLIQTDACCVIIDNFLINPLTLINFIRGVNQKVFFSRSIAVLRHKTERNLGMMLQNSLFVCLFNDVI